MFKLLKILILCGKESLEKLKCEMKEQKGGFLSMSLGTLAGKGIVRAGYSHSSSSALRNDQSQRTMRAGYGSINIFFFSHLIL